MLMEYDVTGLKYKDFLVKTYCLEDMAVLMLCFTIFIEVLMSTESYNNKLNFFILKSPRLLVPA